MLLDKELYVSMAMTQIDKAHKRSWIALGLLIAYIGLNLPPYSLPIDYYYFIQICSLLSLGCAVLSINFAVISLVSLIRHRTVRKARFYIAFIINLVILLMFGIAIILWMLRHVNRE